MVFLIHNRVKDIKDIAALVHRVCPDLSIAIAHGQMEGHKLEEIMRDFIDMKYDVMVSTSIVESGLDITNVNTIIINNAHNFGLSDLHQLRGRVGRSNKKAFCYLISPPMSTLTRDARKRLQTIEEFSSLGSGFNIAMRDLDIRGAGNLLGAEQSGFIADIGFDMYHKILDEAIAELKETEFKDLFAEELKKDRKFIRDCQIDTDLEVLIPDNYVSNINERLSLYTHLDNLESEDSLIKFSKDLVDRFGPLPPQVKELMEAIRVRWLAKELGFERIMLKNKMMKCYFISNKESHYFESAVFGNILRFIQQNPLVCKVKETGKYLVLTFTNTSTLYQAKSLLTELLDFAREETSV